MSLFSKKKDPAKQGKDVRKELNDNLANVHVRVAQVRAEEARTRMRYQETLRKLEDQERFLANAKRAGRDEDTAAYEEKIASLREEAETLRAAHEEAKQNLIYVEGLEAEMRVQLEQLDEAGILAAAQALPQEDDDDWYYAETPPLPKPAEDAGNASALTADGAVLPEGAPAENETPAKPAADPADGILVPPWEVR